MGSFWYIVYTFGMIIPILHPLELGTTVPRFLSFKKFLIRKTINQPNHSILVLILVTLGCFIPTVYPPLLEQQVDPSNNCSLERQII